ncbi:hypothetical protein RJT34_29774 [Clitoria ternatea]|uniref:Uncharacterized protein n=1 Tax=Clitoria ternatea TaxID=43366 RepID=A0AAN9I6P9_CLITE
MRKSIANGLKTLSNFVVFKAMYYVFVCAFAATPRLEKFELVFVIFLETKCQQNNGTCPISLQNILHRNVFPLLFEKV